MIQMCRYADILKKQDTAYITMVCHPALKTLFASMSSIDKVMAFDEDIPQSGWDFWTPPMSLPYYCNTRLDSVPANIPYLHANPELINRWKSELPAQGVRVGLVWKGNPKLENDAERSIQSLSVLTKLGTINGVSFISLQKGAGEDEAQNPPAGLSITHLGEKIENFADTAAIIVNLDLVICVDTAAAHLAGALGKPCWVLLPDYITDWRWLINRADSIWYPDVMRLFRQPKKGDWASVISEVTEALKQFVTNRHT